MNRTIAGYPAASPLSRPPISAGSSSDGLCQSPPSQDRMATVNSFHATISKASNSCSQMSAQPNEGDEPALLSAVRPSVPAPDSAMNARLSTSYRQRAGISSAGCSETCAESVSYSTAPESEPGPSRPLGAQLASRPLPPLPLPTPDLVIMVPSIPLAVESVCPPKTLLDVLADKSAPFSADHGKPADASPATGPLSPATSLCEARDGWIVSSILPSPDVEGDGSVQSSPSRPSMLKRPSWKKLQPRNRSVSIDALHTLTSLPVISSLKVRTTASRKDRQAARICPDSESTTPGTPAGEGDAIASCLPTSGRAGGQARADIGTATEAGRRRRATEHAYQHDKTKSPLEAARQRFGVPLDGRRKLYHSTDPALQDWGIFVRAYANGQLDLNVPPPVPSVGKPDPSVVPDGNGSPRPGPLLAPLPEWEEERQRSLRHLRLEDMPAERWARIQAICDELQQRSQCLETIFAIIESDCAHLWCTGTGYFPPGLYSRGHAMCAHTILNRHDGLLVPDLEKDWRWSKNPLLEGVRYYAAMPVCAPDGIPLGALCCVGREPRTQPEECERDLLLLRELSAAISLELEGWAAECHQKKIRAIQEGWQKLERHLRGQDDVRPGARIVPLKQLLDISGGLPAAPVNLPDVASLGLDVTWRDIADVNFCSSIIAEAVGFETVYVAAVTSPASRCVIVGCHGLDGPVDCLDPGPYLKALHSSDDGIVYESPPQHDSRPGRVDTASQSTSAIFCPVSFNVPDKHQRGGSHVSELSTIAESQSRHHSQDTLGPTTPAPFKRCSIISTDTSPCVGFVLVAVTRSRDRIIVEEDVRYLQGFADVIGTLWQKCLPSAMASGREAMEEAAKIAATKAAELEKRARQPAYIAASKKAMRATGEGFTALMRGMHLSSSRSSADLGAETGKRPRLRRQRTLGSMDSQTSLGSESPIETEMEATAGFYRSKGLSGPSRATTSHGSNASSQADSPVVRPTVVHACPSTGALAPIALTKQELASIPAAGHDRIDSVAQIFNQPMGALPGCGLAPRLHRSKARCSAC